MARPKRRLHTMQVTVSANAALTAAEVRREVRAMIRSGVGWTDYDRKFIEVDIKVRQIKPATKVMR